MNYMKLGRLLLAIGFAALASYFGYLYATMPYELVTTTMTSTRAVPSGDGVFFLAVGCVLASIIAAFFGDWN